MSISGQSDLTGVDQPIGSRSPASSDYSDRSMWGPTDQTYGQGKFEDPISSGMVSLEDARLLLETYKLTMTPHFPCVIIQDTETVETLRSNKPFLLLSILTAASYEKFLLQRALGRGLKKQIATRMIIRGEISFELLQGLLVLVAW